jgi:cellulose synthase/poly-beta-1,6-N-acetylglucosamine synthase-like glycosyltransferase
MTLVFWLSLAFIGYVYVGYPLWLMTWNHVRQRHRVTSVADDGSRQRDFELPTVSIIVAARNEAQRLVARVDNLLALDFPSDRRQIIVVLDGATDGSQEILQRYGSAVEVVCVPPSGKAAALNAGAAAARHDILVFADARQRFAEDALRELLVPFEDPMIGGVTGELLLDAEAALFSNRRRRTDRRTARRGTSERRQLLTSTIGDGVGLYWRYEKALRRMESTLGSTLGATGAIYAIRRTSWTDLPPDTLLDDVLVPIRVVLNGFRVVFTDRARAFDRAADDAAAEARRKIRTLAGNVQLLRLEPQLLLPWRNPVWLQFVSHKLGRLLVPYALVALFASSLALVQRPLYAVFVAAQLAFYLLAGYGAWLEAAARAQKSASSVSAGTVPVREVAS